MQTPSNFSKDVQPQLETACLTIARLVQEYMSDPTNRAKYEAWYRDRYGRNPT